MIDVKYSEFVGALVKDPSDIVKDFIENPVKAHLMHMAVGVGGEAGELSDAIKRAAIYGKEADVENIIEELGDLRFYMQGVMNSFGITDEMVISHNKSKLAKRYSEGAFSNAQAQRRADKDAA